MSSSHTHTHSHEHSIHGHSYSSPHQEFGQLDQEGDQNLQNDYFDEEALREERDQFEAVVGALAFYKSSISMQWRRLKKQFEAIPKRHKDMFNVPSSDTFLSPQDRFVQLSQASLVNHKFIECVLKQDSEMIGQPMMKNVDEYLKQNFNGLPDSRNPKSSFNAEKIASTLYQVAREWSVEGKEERDESYKPIIDELKRRIPVDDQNRYQYRVFCPGSGLGRLPLEICFEGYASCANEYSYFMLLFSNYILNECRIANEHAIHPWIHQIVNIQSSKEQLSTVTIPDVPAVNLPKDAQFGCAVGDFLELSLSRENFATWHAICTCFFIDTAHNVVELMEAIWRMLKPGGIWINLGPLLYHYSEMSTELSLELTLDQVLHAARTIGFSIESQRTIPCRYTVKPCSMLQNLYQAELWVGVKPINEG